MNERFVCIKVDREEMPDVDQIYQQALQLQGEHGGWPLTMFLTPDGAPFFGGTYFPKRDGFGRPSFRRLLDGALRAYRNDSATRVLENARQFRDGLRAAGARTGAQPGDDATSCADSIDRAAAKLAVRIDRARGRLRGRAQVSQSEGDGAASCAARVAPRRPATPTRTSSAAR